MAYSWWTHEDWTRLRVMCEEDMLDMPMFEIHQCAEAYMEHGTDNGGNRWGLAGTIIGFNVERVARAHRQAGV